MGFVENTWEKVLTSKLASHEVRALINIASGTEIKNIGVEYRKEREKDSLPPDRLASRLK